MSFEVTGYDKDGNPSHVVTDDGYMQCGRPFDKDKDGWMLNQLNPLDFDAIQTGRQMESLVDEINHLRRENYRLNNSLNEIFKTKVL